MRNTARLLTALSAFGMLTAATAAHAGGPGADAGLLPFARMDADGDGFLTREEVRKAREARFAKYDANGDGKVTLAEFVAGTEAWLAIIDRNGDGKVDLSDFGRN